MEKEELGLGDLAKKVWMLWTLFSMYMRYSSFTIFRMTGETHSQLIHYNKQTVCTLLSKEGIISLLQSRHFSRFPESRTLIFDVLHSPEEKSSPSSKWVKLLKILHTGTSYFLWKTSLVLSFLLGELQWWLKFSKLYQKH